MSVDDVRAIAERMDPVPQIVSLDPHTLGEVLGDVRTLAQATDAKDAAVSLVQDAAARIDRVRLATRAAPKVRVAMLEWLDPVFVGGHWVPQLIEHAGGEDLLGLPGEPSEQRSWEEVAAAQAAGRRRRAVRLRRRARLRGGAELRRRAGSARRRADRRRRRRRLVLAAPARAWSTASSGSATCCTPTGVPEPPGGVRDVSD